MRMPSLILAAWVVVCIGCESGPRSGRGLRLPDGDLAQGEVAFRDLGCEYCHDLVGEPPPEGERFDVIVTLGGEVTRVESHGELVTSIVRPSHQISGRYPRDQVADGDRSKMVTLNDTMTVAQLIDLTAFLQSKYVQRREPMYTP